MNSPPVTLQISLAPSDYIHARALLPHQLRTWRGQVDEILLTVDFHRSAGRFSARWAEGRDLILPLARSVADARVVEVDYSPAQAARVSSAFFGERPVPAKDYRGGPYYSYFFGLHAARHDHVLHVDSDMFFGGGSQGWLNEALARLRQRREILVIAPLPGPPAPDGSLRQLPGRPVPGESHSFDFTEMSTRLFLLDRRRFAGDFGQLTPRRPSLRNTVKAWIDGNPPAELPEVLISRQMQARGFVRHEFLGAAPGLWSLHPPYRSRDFFTRLPALVARIEAGDLPAAQRGDHDLNASMVDWSEGLQALKQNRWWRRLGARLH